MVYQIVGWRQVTKKRGEKNCFVDNHLIFCCRMYKSYKKVGRRLRSTGFFCTFPQYKIKIEQNLKRAKTQKSRKGTCAIFFAQNFLMMYRILQKNLITRAKSAQNFGSQSKFYVFKTKIQKYPLKSHEKFRNSLKQTEIA